MTTLKKVSELFTIKYGVSLALSDLEECKKSDKDSINFVSRTDKNNGISAFVKKIKGITPNEANTISVAVSGSVLASFYQPEPYYSGFHLYVLTPIQKMTSVEMIYYSICIRSNRYRYNFGRQANKTLKDILIPSEMPKEFSNISMDKITSVTNKKLINNKTFNLNISQWKPFRYDELFKIERGRGGRKKDLKKNGKIPFVTSIDKNNGWLGMIDSLPYHKGNVISVNRNGSVGEAYYQHIPFCSTEDVHIFNPKFELNQYIAMFLISLIKKEKYRYNYGRKWGMERMNKTIIRLPADKNGKPDWQFMENYIKSLPYSSSMT
jgi:hypothetical protein